MSEEPKRRGRGRPVGPIYPGGKHVRLTAEDLEDLEYLKRAWRTTDSDVLRRALREMARREKRKGAE